MSNVTDDQDAFDEAQDVASGIISTLGIAILRHDAATVGNIMRDIDSLFLRDPDAALDLFKVTAMMCAKNTAELYSKVNPEWRKTIDEQNEREKGNED